MRSKTIELLDCVPDEFLTCKSADNRTVAQIFAHIHDGVCIWMKSHSESWPCDEIGETHQHAREKLREALVESGKGLMNLFGSSNNDFLISDISIVGTGADLICYLAAHEAHHHGEIATLVLQAGQSEVHKSIWSEGKEI